MKCAKCRLQRANGSARAGKPVTTGRRRHSIKRGAFAVGNIDFCYVYEYGCKACGYVGWSRHRAIRKQWEQAMNIRPIKASDRLPGERDANAKGLVFARKWGRLGFDEVSWHDVNFYSGHEEWSRMIVEPTEQQRMKKKIELRIYFGKRGGTEGEVWKAADATHVRFVTSNGRPLFQIRAMPDKPAIEIRGVEPCVIENQLVGDGVMIHPRADNCVVVVAEASRLPLDTLRRIDKAKKTSASLRAAAAKRKRKA